jgi:hypothetical protein
MRVERDNSAKQPFIFSATYKLARKNRIHLKPLYSISSALFCAFAQSIFPRNQFIFCRLRTLSDNYRGVGVSVMFQDVVPSKRGVPPICPGAPSCRQSSKKSNTLVEIFQNARLALFWPRALSKAPTNTNHDPSPGACPTKVQRLDNPQVSVDYRNRLGSRRS